MAHLAAVVALLALRTVAGHVPIAAAGVAGHSTLRATSAAEAAAKAAAETAGAGRTIARNVTDLATLVALGSAHASSSTAGSASTAHAARRFHALAADVARLTAAVAGHSTGLFLRGGAFAADMALLVAIVASRAALGRTVASLMGSVAAYRATSSVSTRSHMTWKKVKGVDSH